MCTLVHAQDEGEDGDPQQYGLTSFILGRGGESAEPKGDMSLVGATS